MIARGRKEPRRRRGIERALFFFFLFHTVAVDFFFFNFSLQSNLIRPFQCVTSDGFISGEVALEGTFSEKMKAGSYYCG